MGLRLASRTKVFQHLQDRKEWVGEPGGTVAAPFEMQAMSEALPAADALVELILQYLATHVTVKYPTQYSWQFVFEPKVTSVSTDVRTDLLEHEFRAGSDNKILSVFTIKVENAIFQSRLRELVCDEMTRQLLGHYIECTWKVRDGRMTRTVVCSWLRAEELAAATEGATATS